MYNHFKSFRSLKKENAFRLPVRNDCWRASLQPLCCAAVLKCHYSCCYFGQFFQMQALALNSPWWIAKGCCGVLSAHGPPDCTGWLSGLSHLEQGQPVLFPCPALGTLLPSPASTWSLSEGNLFIKPSSACSVLSFKDCM